MPLTRSKFKMKNIKVIKSNRKCYCTCGTVILFNHYNIIGPGMELNDGKMRINRGNHDIGFC